MIADKAHEWIGTPFHWGAAVKGVGCDCKGLIAGVAAECGREEAKSVEALACDYGAGKFTPQRLRSGLQRLFDKVSEAQPGDVLLMTLKGVPQHLAICVEAEGGKPVRMVHTYPGRGVVKAKVGSMHRIDSIWRWRVSDAA